MVLMLSVACVTAHGQEYKGATDSVGFSKGVIFEDFEMPATFNGGLEGLKEYLAENVKMPDKYSEVCITGRVIVSFVIERDGSISDAKVMKSLDPELDAEALRVVMAMPKWSPAKNRGKAVRTRMAIPICFK